MHFINTTTIFLFFLCISNAIAFVAPRTRNPAIKHALFSASSTDEEQEVLAEIKSMRVREIKQELQSAGVDTSDAFEKDELVKRLVAYRKNKPAAATSGTATSSKQQQTSSSSISRVPMDFHSLTPNKSVASKNSNIFLRPSPGKYPSIQLSVPGQSRPLTLLVDTACSGLVLRPNIVKQYNLPILNGGVSMMAAGGSTHGASMSKLSAVVLDDGTRLDDMMVAGQDIGALPSALDGIIGLTFLNQFKSVTFDFDKGELILCKKNKKGDSIDFTDMKVLAESETQLCRLGVWTADITLDGRGPVKMLIDTGAASTFLNWKGVGDLNMSRDHPLISRNTEALGAMGADNMALHLSHRFVLKRRVNLASDPSMGAFGPLGIDIQEIGSLNIDIGDLPVLEALKSDNVGGILGSDFLMRCDLLHLDFAISSSPKVSLLQKQNLNGQ